MKTIEATSQRRGSTSSNHLRYPPQALFSIEQELQTLPKPLRMHKSRDRQLDKITTSPRNSRVLTCTFKCRANSRLFKPNCITLILVVWVTSAFNARSAVELGRSVPPLQIAEWVAGGPVEIRTVGGSNRIVLTFLETSCDSCKAVMPLLASLRRRSESHGQGVTFVGVSPEPPDVIRRFLSDPNHASSLGLELAADLNRLTVSNYLETPFRRSVPYSFIIETNGNAIWQGHPLLGLEEALQALATGNYDISKAKHTVQAELLIEDYFRPSQCLPTDSSLIQGGVGDSNRTALAELILKKASATPWLLNAFAWRIATDQSQKERDFELASRAAKAAFESSDRTNASFADTYALTLFNRSKFEEAVRVQKVAVQLAGDDKQRVRLGQSLLRYEEALRAPAKQ